MSEYLSAPPLYLPFYSFLRNSHDAHHPEHCLALVVLGDSIPALQLLHNIRNSLVPLVLVILAPSARQGAKVAPSQLSPSLHVADLEEAVLLRASDIDEAACLQRLPEICFLEAFQRQESRHRAVLSTSAPVGVLQGLDMRHVDPDGGDCDATGLQGAIDVLGSGIVIAQAVEGEARDGMGEVVGREGNLLGRHDGRADGPVVGLRECGAALNELRIDVGRVDVDVRAWGQRLHDAGRDGA